MQPRCMDEYVDKSKRLLAGMWEFPNCAGEGGQGWASTMCAILSIGGIQLLCTGILGQYLAKTYLESKHRPIYIIDSTNVERGNNNK